MWKLVNLQTEVLCPVALQNQCSGWRRNLATAAEIIMEHHVNQIMIPPIVSRIAPPETPLDRDRRTWEFNSREEIRMNGWTPHNSTYPGPRHDINNNLIVRHTGYTPSTSPRHMEVGPSDHSDDHDETAYEDSDLTPNGSNWENIREVHC